MQSCRDKERVGALVWATAADTKPDNTKQALIVFILKNQTPRAPEK